MHQDRRRAWARAVLVLVAVATLLGTALVGQGIGLTLGSRLHIALPDGPARQVDRGAGSVLGVIGVLVLSDGGSAGIGGGAVLLALATARFARTE